MKKPLWNVRTRLMLTLGLVVLPAAALVLFGYEHLTSIEKGHAVENAIQNEVQQKMAIVDKRLSERAYQLVDLARLKFPSPLDENVAEQLDKVLAAYPWASCAFVFDQSGDTVVRLGARELQSPEAEAGRERFATMFRIWFGEAGEGMLVRMRNAEKNGEPPYISYAEASAGDGKPYVPMMFFPIPAAPKDRVAIGGIMFDTEHLSQFFSSALNAIMTEIPATKEDRQAAVMLRYQKDGPPLAASSGWDGGEPEVERKTEGAFPNLVMAIRYPGTTIEAITQKFLRTSYIILGSLSVLLIAGLFFTYRGVTKTVELAKLKSDIVSNVSHELRTPLALIRLYAETLELGRIPTEAKKLEYYRIVRKESERLTALINNILDFSRIEAGKKEYEFRETDLPSLVRDTLDSYHYQIEQNGFRYEERISSDLPPVKVDREAIARSLLNLVNNAIKYSSSDKYLAVSLYRENGSIKLDVVDHGIGIPRAEQNRIFDKFYRVCDPLHHESKGSGLGLSLVQHIVRAHGGEVAVESTPGKGSKFSIILPLDPESRAAGACGTKAIGEEPHGVGA
ncbi:MAG TPA: HAMP domain-containing sensor histidine kinase [Candidatus Angelobacter sp.]